MHTQSNAVVSNLRLAWQARERYLFRIAAIFCITFALAVFSGFLHYVSTSLPAPVITFTMGLWVASVFYLALAD